jgi:hypothetical protein
MAWRMRLERVRSRWLVAHPQCGERDCNLMRRIWRRIGWAHGRIRLRGHFYCAPQCFENVARECFSDACAPVAAAAPIQHRIPLGLLMLSRGHLSSQQLQMALAAQRSGGHRRIGEWLEELGFATEQQVTAALGLQWACPVLVWRAPCDLACGEILPYRLLERFRMLPVHFVAATRVFHVAFCDGIDYTALYAIEQMLDCRTQACLVGRSIMDRELGRIRRDARTGDVMCESWRDPAAMAHITSDYAIQMRAEQVRIASCGEYIWVRLAAERKVLTLLFRHAMPPPRDSTNFVTSTGRVAS